MRFGSVLLIALLPLSAAFAPSQTRSAVVSDVGIKWYTTRTDLLVMYRKVAVRSSHTVSH